MSHTPRPWLVGGSTGLINQVAIEPAIGCCYGAGDELKANIKLITAVPDLLEAAKLALAWYEAENNHKLIPDFHIRANMRRESEIALRAAISKATGDTP